MLPYLLTFLRAKAWQAAIAALAATVLPFLVLALYCHPSADDFWQTNIALEKGIWQAYTQILQTWSGRYFTMLLTAANPLVFHSLTGYKVLPVVLLSLFLLAAYFFLSACLPAEKARVRWLLTLVLFALYTGFMPVVSQVFYWMSGAVHYQVAHILGLLLAGLLLRQARQPVAKARHLVLAALLIVLIVGSNETVMALSFYLLGGLWLLHYFFNRIFSPKLLALFLLSAVCAGIVILSPGNAVRSAEYPQQGRLVLSALLALAYAANNSLNWLSSSPVLIFTVLIIPVCRRTCFWPHSWQRLSPLLTWLFFYGALATCFFVSYYSRGTHAVPRVQDTIYLVFLAGWFLNVLHTVKFLQAKGYGWPSLPAYAVYLLWLLGLLWFFNSPASNIRVAWSDLVSGRAARYDQEMKARYAFLKSSDCQVCPIPEVKNIPSTIFFEEIPADTTWKNRYFSQYFGKKLMRMQRH